MTLTPEQQKLAESGKGLVFHIAGKMLTPQEQTDDDFISDGMLALCRAAVGFDPSRGRAWSTYACTAIANAFLKTRRNVDCRARLRARVAVRREHSGFSIDAGLKRVDHIDEIEVVTKRMRPKDIALAERVADGERPTDIAKDMGVSRHAICMRQRYAAARLRTIKEAA